MGQSESTSVVKEQGGWQQQLLEEVKQKHSRDCFMDLDIDISIIQSFIDNVRKVDQILTGKVPFAMTDDEAISNEARILGVSPEFIEPEKAKINIATRLAYVYWKRHQTVALQWFRSQHIMLPETDHQTQLMTKNLQYQLVQKLPVQAKQKWRSIYNSQADGMSFNLLLNALLDNQSRSEQWLVFIVQDTDNSVFGAFSATKWIIQPKFYGTSLNGLFKVDHQIAYYGGGQSYNQNFQYLSVGNRTLTNGIGFGGQIDYFGLFIDDKLERGHSRGNPSTTYGNNPLSSKEDFTIKQLEVWCVYDGKSIDVTPVPELKQSRQEAMNFLETAGVQMYSRQAGVESKD